jgi:hypothetical protein
MAERNNPTGFLGTSSTPDNAEFSADRYPGQIAQIVAVDDPDFPNRQKEYRLVKPDSTMTTYPFDGAAAYWANRALGLVTTDPTGRQGRPAGIFCKAPSTLVNRVIYVQVRGRKNNVKAVDAPTATPTAAGLFVVPSSTAAKVNILASASPATFPPFGVSASVINVVDNTFAVDLDVFDVSS